MAISEIERAWHYRMINASIVALQIRDGALSSSADGYGHIRLKAPPTCFVRGVEGINAGFLGVTTDDYAILAFRGTLTSTDTDNSDAVCLDWTQDRLYDPQNWPVGSNGAYGKTCTGFSNAMASLWPDVQAALATTMPGKRGLWITGHSKGGAMAFLAASLIGRDYPIEHVVTFGAPLVGNDTFKTSYTAAGLLAKTIHYQNQHDGVPMAPSVDTPPIPIPDVTRSMSRCRRSKATIHWARCASFAATSRPTSLRSKPIRSWRSLPT